MPISMGAHVEVICSGIRLRALLADLYFELGFPTQRVGELGGPSMKMVIINLGASPPGTEQEKLPQASPEYDLQIDEPPARVDREPENLQIETPDFLKDEFKLENEN